MMPQIFFDITKRCNAQCIYCFTNSEITPVENELSENEIEDLFYKLIELRIESVSIGGGEPLLKDVASFINKFGDKIKISITSNGMLIEEKFIQALKDSKSTKLTISLDSINPETNEKVRVGINTSKVIENIKWLSSIDEVRKRLSIRSTVSMCNIKELLDIINFCNKEKIPKLKVNSTNPFGRATLTKNIIPEFSDFMIKLQEIEKYCSENKLYTDIELPIKKYLKEDNNCTLGNNSLYIDSFGNCYPCAFSNRKLCLGNIRLNNISEILSSNKNFSHCNEICNKCEINRYKNY